MHVLYPGSFDPPTLGHRAIVERASQLFSRVTVVVSHNPSKEGWLPSEVRCELLRHMTEEMEGVEVVVDGGLVVDAAERHGVDAILKGLRSEADFNNEQVMARANAVIGKGLQTLFLMAEGDLQGVSSSLVRQIHNMGGDVSPFVPDCVYQGLLNRA